MSRLPRPVWASLAHDEDEARDPNLRFVNDGDSYIVELASGEQLWANYTRDGGFVACDDEGNEVARPGSSVPQPLDDVQRVMVRGHVKGFGPSCPKAGEPLKIGLVVIQPTKLTSGSAGFGAGNDPTLAPSGPGVFGPAQPGVSLMDRVVADVLARVPAAMVKAKQLVERRHDEPVTSSERDTRHHQESA